MKRSYWFSNIRTSLKYVESSRHLIDKDIRSTTSTLHYDLTWVNFRPNMSEPIYQRQVQEQGSPDNSPTQSQVSVMSKEFKISKEMVKQ